MKILIPLLSEKENDPQFIEKASKGATEIILLVVVDPSPKERFGFAAGFLQKARGIMDEAKKNNITQGWHLAYPGRFLSTKSLPY